MDTLFQKLGHWKKELIVAAMVFLVSSLSFGLGYLANHEDSRAPIIIEKCSERAAE